MSKNYNKCTTHTGLEPAFFLSEDIQARFGNWHKELSSLPSGEIQWAITFLNNCSLQHKKKMKSIVRYLHAILDSLSATFSRPRTSYKVGRGSSLHALFLFCFFNLIYFKCWTVFCSCLSLLFFPHIWLYVVSHVRNKWIVRLLPYWAYLPGISRQDNSRSIFLIFKVISWW